MKRIPATTWGYAGPLESEPGRSRKHKSRTFILHTHIENDTPYRKHDLIALAHMVASTIWRENDEHLREVSELRFLSGCKPNYGSWFTNSEMARVWLPGTNATSLECAENLIHVFQRQADDELRKRTKTLRRILLKAQTMPLRIGTRRQR